MRKLDLTNYMVEGPPQPCTSCGGSGDGEQHPDEGTLPCEPCEGNGTITPQTEYTVRWSVGEVILSREPSMTARQLLANDDLFRKIRDCPEEAILLEEAEYQQLTRAFDLMTGFGKDDVKLVRRVLEAEEVEVQEKADTPVNGAEDPEAVPAVQ